MTSSGPSLARRLGTGDAVVLGLGSMLGAGVFAAFAPAAEAAGAGLLIGLAIAVVVAYCNATASAQLAAQMGLPYVFANHFGIPGMDHILDIYRSNYVPSAQFPKPTTLLPVNVVVASTQEEAERRAQVQRLTTARLRTGGALTAQPSVEAVENYDWSARELGVPQQAYPMTFVGSPDRVAADLHRLAAEYQSDEIMISPVAGAFANEDPATAPGRTQTLELLARELLSRSL